MHDSTVQLSRVIATALWTCVGILLAAAWILILFLPSAWAIAGMLGGTACATSAAAAVAHIRCYSARICSLIRATSGMTSPMEPTRLARVPEQTMR